MILLAVAMIMPMQIMAFASDFTDMPDDWSAPAIRSAVSNGLLKGSSGKIMPHEYLTRAQMAAIVNRAFGATEKAALSGYVDVSPGAWYYDDMAKAVHMGTFVGFGGKLNPDGYITRQEAFLVLSKAFKLPDGSVDALNAFEDRGSISSWAVGAISAMKMAGYVHGSNGKVYPLNYITRAEYAQLMDNMLKSYYSLGGIYTSVPSGNVIINASDITLKNVTVAGDLIITGDNVVLDGVKVTGRIVICGGGAVSVHIIGASDIQNVVVALSGGQAKLYADNGINIPKVVVNGKGGVSIEGNIGTLILETSDITAAITNANIGSVVIEGENCALTVAAGSNIDSLTAEAPNAAIEVLGKVTNIVVNAEGTTISGSGNVENVSANANNISITTPDTKVTASEGATGVTAGGNNVPAGNTVNTNTGSPGRNSGGSGDTATAAPTITGVSPEEGPAAGGTTVTITGTNLTGATAVSFGGAAATGFTVNSDAQITATVPAGTGTVNVTVTTAGGTATATGAYTYIVVPAPAITGVSPNKGPEVGGTTVAINGTNFTGATAVSFGGTDATSFIVLSDTQIEAVTPTKLFWNKVIVEVTTPGGTAASEYGAYTFVPAPSVLSVNPGIGPEAGGNIVTISGYYLEEATAVKFGDEEAEIIENSANDIKVKVPAGTDTVEVTVTTAGGTSRKVGVTYGYVPASTIEEISPSTGPAFAEVTITGTRLSGATEVKFGATPAIYIGIVSDTEIKVGVPAGTGTVDISVTTAGGTVTLENAYTYMPLP